MSVDKESKEEIKDKELTQKIPIEISEPKEVKPVDKK